MLVIAHAGHWLVSVAYFAPVVGFLIWLVVTQYREKVRDRREREARRGRAAEPPLA